MTQELNVSKPTASDYFVMQSELATAPVQAVKIIRAAHLGMCFGVRDAIDLALDQGGKRPLTVLGDLVHNEAVLAELRASGIRIENNMENVTTASVMITAHGASEKALRHARDTGFSVIEATCPLVHYAHSAVKKLVRENFHPIIIGRRGHVEVRGLTGDLECFDIVDSEEDIGQLAEHSRFGVASQTTQPIERVRYFVELIRRRFPRSEVRFIDTVCQPTKQRQTAAVEVARQSDVVVVIGGANSNNTRELAATCCRYCARVHHVRDAADLRVEWFESAKTIGLTAGTSTPDRVIEEVEQHLRALDFRHK